MTASRFPLLVAFARFLLEPSDVDRMVLPTLADALVEHGDHRRIADRILLAWRVLLVVCVASYQRVCDSGSRMSWWPVTTACVAGLVGSLGLEPSQLGHPIATSHLVFVALGAVAASAIAVMPPRWYRLLGIAASIVAVAALVLVPWVGQAYDGNRRWLSVGPLTVNVAVLVTPVFAEWMGIVARWRRAWVALFVVGLVLVASIAQPNPPAVVIFGMIAIATTWRSSQVLPVVACVACAAAWSLAHNDPPSPVPHVEGALSLLAHRSAVLLVIASIAIVATIAASVRPWIAMLRLTTTTARDAESRLAASAVGIVSLVVIPGLMGDGGVPWISHGGSAVFAAFTFTGLSMRLAHHIRRDSTPAPVRQV